MGARFREVGRRWGHGLERWDGDGVREVGRRWGERGGTEMG